MQQLPIKGNVYALACLILAILLATYFRVMLLAVYPALVIILFLLFRFRIHLLSVFLLGLVLFNMLLSYRHGVFLKYNLVSLYFYVPFILLVFATPQPTGKTNLVNLFMNVLAAVIFVNNIVGLVQYLYDPGDDNFVGLYGRFTVTQNGLSLVNGILFYYFLLQFQEHRKPFYAFLSFFFLACCVLGFYGAGLLALLAAIGLVYLKFSFKGILRIIALSIAVLVPVYFIFKLVSPLTLDYNIAILKRFLFYSEETAPRKLIAFVNYGRSYPQNFLDFFLGSGPGTFNSRSAFMVGSPTYFNFELIKSDNMPPYFAQYAYPLWNITNTGPYDGFMNQPFSSILALLGEYGFLVTSLLLGFFISQVVQGHKKMKNLAPVVSNAPERSLYRFTAFFLLLLLLFDNYIEYPEILLLLLLLNKLLYQQGAYPIINEPSRTIQPPAVA